MKRDTTLQERIRVLISDAIRRCHGHHDIDCGCVLLIMDVVKDRDRRIVEQDAEIARLRPIAEQAREGGKLKTFISEQDAELSRLRATVERVRECIHVIRDGYGPAVSRSLTADYLEAALTEGASAK